MNLVGRLYFDQMIVVHSKLCSIVAIVGIAVAIVATRLSIPSKKKKCVH